MPTIQRNCGSGGGTGVTGRNHGVVANSMGVLGWDGNMASQGEGHGEDRMPGLHQCLLRGCYSSHEKCDGKFDCEDRADEQNCEYWTDGLFSSKFYSLFGQVKHTAQVGDVNMQSTTV